MAEVARAMAERIDCDHMVLLEVATELLELNDLAFAARLTALRSDTEGRSVLGDLLGSLQVALIDFERANRALYVLRVRIIAGLGTMGGVDVA